MYIVGTNIISSLGFDTKENFRHIAAGLSGVKRYEAGTLDMPEPFVASLIDRRRLEDHFSGIDNNHIAREATLLEKAAIASITDANTEARIDLSSSKTLILLSTTKGNVDSLSTPDGCGHLPFLWHSAKVVNSFFGNPNKPLVVSNACISGVAAQITASRELVGDDFEHVVVVGVDMLSKFIVSGFASFRALSAELCRPFDRHRCGLNLGEAAATIIFSAHKDHSRRTIRFVEGAIRNDATHISAPSRTAEGLSRALQYITYKHSIYADSLAFISAHGTATPYNDSMEINAVYRSRLESVPIGSLKAYFGHTLGAAGLLETIISCEALEAGVVIPTLNCTDVESIQATDGRTFYPNVTSTIRRTDKRYFLKMISGFGGVNAVALFHLEPDTQNPQLNN